MVRIVQQKDRDEQRREWLDELSRQTQEKRIHKQQEQKQDYAMSVYSASPVPESICSNDTDRPSRRRSQSAIRRFEQMHSKAVVPSRAPFKRELNEPPSTQFFFDSRTLQDHGINHSRHKSILGHPIEKLTLKPTETVPLPPIQQPAQHLLEMNPETAAKHQKDAATYQWKEYLKKQIEEKKQAQLNEKIQNEREDRMRQAHLLMEHYKPPVGKKPLPPVDQFGVPSNQLHPHQPDPTEYKSKHVRGRTNEEMAGADIYHSRIPISAALKLVLQQKAHKIKSHEKQVLTTNELQLAQEMSYQPTSQSEPMAKSPIPVEPQVPVQTVALPQITPQNVSNTSKNVLTKPVLEKKAAPSFDDTPIHPKPQQKRRSAKQRVKSAKKEVKPATPVKIVKREPVVHQIEDPLTRPVPFDETPIQPQKSKPKRELDELPKLELKPSDPIAKKGVTPAKKSVYREIPKHGNMETLPPEDKEALKHLKAIQSVLEEEKKKLH
ncbi:hypothetical protein EDD86DRAFT_198983 [Gorgonomyces haynaldii]|nr:hypothetical protein EDD86DRAFT_198983 [Gorgonomyces haynaldii]